MLVLWVHMNMLFLAMSPRSWDTPFCRPLAEPMVMMIMKRPQPTPNPLSAVRTGFWSRTWINSKNPSQSGRHMRLLGD